MGVEDEAVAVGGEGGERFADDPVGVPLGQQGGDSAQQQLAGPERFDVEAEVAQADQGGFGDSADFRRDVHDERLQEELALRTAGERLSETLQEDALVGGVLVDQVEPRVTLRDHIGAAGLAEDAQLSQSLAAI